ncbi:hypothetical protein B6S44_18385 [Bosea sp. Tri-44]|uniref:hypothetical protein n=1 Tax=Bosea sp. Tri-44 TaxID=1972137 RepID=UPI00100E0AAF|nr:hypothetical protein [Bosea sp. Tri-44]RXT52719.1 hypothetical protein B6S44_18385 [Bosea sp. Tri-44]
MIDFIGQKISTHVEAAIQRMVSAEHFRAGSLVSMPVLYPSGASVVIEVTLQQGRCFVSDRGGGHQEAEMMGVQRGYAKEAERIAAESGIRFDGRDMFVAEVDIERLPGAMEVVANSSQLAVSLCALRASERDARDARERLYDKLAEVYPTREIVRDAPVMGASSHRWKIAALVKGSAGASVFEAVTANYNSVVGAAAKFHDLARLDNSPRRIAVIDPKAGIGDFYGVIAPAASSVIEMTSPRAKFEELLAA